MNSRYHTNMGIAEQETRGIAPGVRQTNKRLCIDSLLLPTFSTKITLGL